MCSSRGAVGCESELVSEKGRGAAPAEAHRGTGCLRSRVLLGARGNRALLGCRGARCRQPHLPMGHGRALAHPGNMAGRLWCSPCQRRPERSSGHPRPLTIRKLDVNADVRTSADEGFPQRGSSGRCRLSRSARLEAVNGDTAGPRSPPGNLTPGHAPGCEWRATLARASRTGNRRPSPARRARSPRFRAVHAASPLSRALERRRGCRRCSSR